MKRNWVLYFMVLPGMLILILFRYVPMYGVLMAFEKYSPAKGIMGSEWVGFKHFVTFFRSLYFGRLLGNTFMLGIFSLLFGFPAPIILALLLNEVRCSRFKRVTQTISYVPYFISTVIVVGLLKDMTSTNEGIINTLIAALGGQKIPSTFSEMLDIMRAVKANDPSIVPFQTYWNINYTQRWVADSIGAQKNLVYYDTDAKEFKCSYREESAKRKELIQTLADMYKEGLINSEIQTLSNEQEQNAVASGKWAFTALYNSSLEKEIFKVQPGEKLPFNIQAMTPPADADGVRRLGIAYQHDGIPGWGLVCSSKTKNPEYLAAYMDQVVSPFGRDIFNYGVEGTTYDIVDGEYVMKDGIDKAEYGVGTQYEVWMVGMGPKARSSDGYLLMKEDQDLNLKNFTDGTVKADFDPAFAIFSADDGSEKANIENALNTCIEENEAKFIYGIRDMSEWDAYVAELEKLASIDDLLKLYNGTQVIVRNPERIFVAK